jgi:hypothetical protein
MEKSLALADIEATKLRYERDQAVERHSQVLLDVEQKRLEHGEQFTYCVQILNT